MCAVGEVTILESCDPDTLQAAVRNCDALLVRTNARITRDLLDQAGCLRVIGRGGVGLDNIDLDAARDRGIAVVYAPAAATDAVADLTVGLMLCLLRRIGKGDAAVREGRFLEERAAHRARELSELTLGIVGLGRIGRAVARRCRAGFGMNVIFNDIVAPGWLGFAATPVDLGTLVATADVVSLHVPLTDQTRHLIDGDALASLKRGAILLNTARGAVVDSQALAAALQEGAGGGRLAGAALDVVDPEPLPQGHPLLAAPNTLFTPHVGARTEAGLSRMSGVVEDVIRVLDGREPLYPAWP